jgi:hypothetical protein
VIEYDNTAFPAVIPVTTPEGLIVATAVLLEDQTPPIDVVAKTVVDPTQTSFEPVIAATVGNG